VTTNRSTEATQRPHNRRDPSAGRAAAAVVALLAMAPVGFFYAASGLVVPGPWLYLMWLLYAGLLAAAVLLARRRSYAVLVAPVIAAVMWWTLVSLGDAYWGWTG
jgi:pheromone shutdown protein TraB